VKSHLARIAVADSTVLITGETGTGKELAAEMVHRASPRRAKPLIPVNCAAIPETLVESELFGYERGAFTGAHAPREGKFQQAQGGTVFLDEIGDMDFSSQAKLLRAIESKEIQSLGARLGTPLNVRIVAATNQDPEQLVREKRFRKDLYFRLNVARIHLAPLRDRKEDIPLLVENSIRELNRRFGYQVEGCTSEAWDLLHRYDWPGNIRELKNLLEATFIGLRSNLISGSDFPEAFHRNVKAADHAAIDERARLLSTLTATNWNKSRAAEALQWSRMTVYRKMAKYHLSTP
jgi:transcriptional regulator with PAS, ATPase and Fis domain